MKNTPIERHLIDETINEFQIVDFSKATIREVKAIASKAEAASGVEFIKMEMGVPGLPPSAVGVKAEIEALQNGIIAGAGLDVFEYEPLSVDSPLISMKNVMLLPHYASCTLEALIRTNRQSAENVVAFMCRKAVSTILNPEYIHNVRD